LERNLLANKIIRLFTMQTSFSIIRPVTHNLRITAILKLPKLAFCPLSAITTQSLGGQEKGEGYFGYLDIGNLDLFGTWDLPACR